jgi:hypothetical protein
VPAWPKQHAVGYAAVNREESRIFAFFLLMLGAASVEQEIVREHVTLWKSMKRRDE